MTAAGRPVLPERYFHEAVNLRLCLQWNLDDSEFARRGGRIVYLVDANIVVFFVNPVLEARHVVAFESGGAAADHVAGTALITAEFLFSRGLPGQDDYPVLIAPSHAEDLGDVLDAIRRKPAAADPSIPERLAADTHKSLEKLVRRVRNGDLPRDAAVAELRRSVPELATALLDGTIQEANQFLRLYKDDLLRPLAVHPEATHDILAVAESQPERVAAWEERIRQERKRTRIGRTGRGNGAARGHRGMAAEREKTRRDAEALVQAMLLDEAARDSDPPTRYVLVTADRGLFDAYAAWFWDSPDGERRDARFILRSPLQYAPILNVADMPNGIGKARVFQHTCDALDTLLAPLRATDPNRYPRSLSVHRVLARLATNDEGLRRTLRDYYGFDPYDFPKGGTACFEQIRRNWQEGFRDGVVLNAELMRRRAQAEFETLALLLRKDVNLRDAVQEDQRRILAQVEAAHLAINTRVSIARLTSGLDRTRNVPPARAPLIVRAKFPRLLGENGSLEATLDFLAQGADRGLVARLDAALAVRLDPQALLFAACVAHRCGRWHTALQCANRALALLPPGPESEEERYEITYLAASATRFARPSAEAIGRALDLLSQAAAYARGRPDPFGLTRALCEHSALLLVVLYCGCFLAEPPAPLDLPGIDAHFDRLPAQFEEARSALAEAGRGGAERVAQGSLLVLDTQVWANVISAEVLSHLLGPDDTRSARIAPAEKLVTEALAAIEPRLATGCYPPVLAAEHAMARLFRGELGAAEVVSRLSEARARGAAAFQRLTDLDEAEFRCFTEMAKTWIARRIPAQAQGLLSSRATA